MSQTQKDSGHKDSSKSKQQGDVQENENKSGNRPQEEQGQQGSSGQGQRGGSSQQQHRQQGQQQGSKNS